MSPLFKYEDHGFSAKTQSPTQCHDAHYLEYTPSSVASSMDVDASEASVLEFQRLLASMKQQQMCQPSEQAPSNGNRHVMISSSERTAPENIENQIEVLQGEVDRIGGQLQHLHAKLREGASNSPSRSPHALGENDQINFRPSPSTPVQSQIEQTGPTDAFLGSKYVDAGKQCYSPSAMACVFSPASPPSNHNPTSNLETQVQNLQQQLLKSKTAQRSAFKTEQRLMEIIAELREERRRLEDRLMEPHADVCLMLHKTRDALEHKVDRLRAEATQLEAEISTLQMEYGNAANSHTTINGLRQSLSCEHDKLVRQRAAKLKLESQVVQLRRDLDVYNGKQEKTQVALAASNRELVSKLETAVVEADSLRTQLKAAVAAEHSSKLQLQNRESLLEEMRSSAESLRKVNNNLQEEIKARESELTKSLDVFAAAKREAQDRIAELSNALDIQEQSALTAQKQDKEALTQLEGRLHEARRDKSEMAGRLHAEQVQAALARQAMEHAQEQLHQSVFQRKEADKAFQAKFETQISGLKHQHEMNMASARKQYEALQLQYEGSVNASRKLWDQHHCLQKERDRLFTQLQGIKAEMMDLQADRDSLAASLREMKDETRRRMADMLSDKETSLKELEACHLEVIKQLKAKMDGAKREHASVFEASEQAKADAEQKLEDTMRQLERSQSTMATLRQQLQDATGQREQAEQELLVEKQYTEELNGIIVAIKNGNLLGN